ncbi:MAG: penicillin-binding transpeptidase domain-containing protein [Gammaproteobacteria bacterium]|nr:penicillin-binding transpeptidase domain-containing protein [Gammaproteobacteria bacterium]
MIRIGLIVTLFVMLISILCARLVYLNVIDRDFLQDQGDARTIRMERITAHRGLIRDRNGKPLAVSSPVISLWADPGELPTSDEDLAPLARMLGVPLLSFSSRIDKARDRDFVYLRRHLVPAKAREILEMKVPGVYGEREYHRYYPSGEVGAHVVGFTNIDDKGQEGLELSFDRWLAGIPGKKKVLKNRFGEIIRDIVPVSPAVPGKNLDLSLDLRLQYLAYRELKSAVTHYDAVSGSVIVLDVETGRVLAMVNQPSYNPNNRMNLELDFVRNRSVTDVFEPGSIMKPFTVAVALLSGQYTPESVIDTDPGFMRIGSKTIRDPSNRGKLDLGGIIARSSQVGISKLALTLNEYEVWEMFQKVGFGRSTGVGFPGESNGYLPNYRRWKDIERVTFAYGYGLTATPLQLAAAYLTIAAGGVKREVSLLSTGEVMEERLYSNDVADQLKQMLTRVVTEGTGKKAKIESFSVAGKTGTVRKVGKGGYQDTLHIAFFAGMTPVNKPRLVGIVLINEPRTTAYGGGSIAAPVFSRVMAGALRLLNVPPNDIDGAA